MDFQRAFSGAPWEATVGYCRAVRAGDHVYVTGTAPVSEDGGVQAPGDGYGQAARCFEIIAAALAELGTDLSRVVRTRMFVTDITRWATTPGSQAREPSAEASPTSLQARTGPPPRTVRTTDRITTRNPVVQGTTAPAPRLLRRGA